MKRIERSFATTSLAWLIPLFFLLIPLQKRHVRFLKGFSQSIIPEGLDLPSFFSRKCDLYWSDLILVLIVFLILYRFKENLREIFWEGPSKFLMAFSAIALFSIFFSITSSYFLQYYRLFQIFSFFLLASSISFFLRHAKESLATLKKHLVFVLLALVILECSIGIAQYFLQRPVGLGFFPEADISNYCFPIQSSKRWVFDAFLGSNPQSSLLFRCSGTFPHPNMLGGFLFVSLILSFYLFSFVQKRWQGISLCLLIALQALTLVLTFSRAAMIATAIGSILFFALNKRARIFPLCVLALSFIGCFFLFYEQLFDRGGIINYNEVAAFADSERVVYQKIAWKMFTEHPLIGCGFNNFQIVSGNYLPPEKIEQFFSKVHNIYLLILAETGLFGLLAFLLFLYESFRSLLKAVRNNQILGVCFLSLFVGLLWIGCCDHYLFFSLHGRALFFAVGALFPLSLKEGEKASFNPIAG